MSRLDDLNATSVYSVSIDSRSRPSNQPDNKYDIELGRTLDRVKSIQLGSIQIPDCRYAFDSKSQFQYSEPISIPPNMYLFVEQTVVTVDKVTCQTTVAVNTVNILVPPTLNPVTNYISNAPADDDVVITQYDTGLDFAVKYYPLIGQQACLVGGHFPQSLMTAPMTPFPAAAGPVFTPTTLVNNAGYYGPGPTNIDNSYKYALGYLNTLSSSAGNYDTRHLIPGTAFSYVHAPKPTLVELFVMLNSALAAHTGASTVNGLITNASNTAPIVITCAAPHGLHDFDQVVIAGVLGNTASNGSFFVTVASLTTFSLNQSVGNGAYAGGGTFTCVRALATLVQLGFDDSNNTIIATGPTRTLADTRFEKRTVSLRFPNPPTGASSLMSYIGFGVSRLDPPARATVPNFIIRNVAVRPGNYTPLELTAMMNVRLNPLLFDETDPALRTLNYLLPGGGAPAAVIIPKGRYFGVQLAAFLNYYMSGAPANIQVSFNDATGRFTFQQRFGLSISLILAGADNARTALRLGFEPVNYSGNSTFTSVNQAVYGVTSSQSYPSNTYFMSADESQHHFTFDTGDAPTFKTVAGVNTAGVDAVWEPIYEGFSVADGFGSTLTTNDVLFAQSPFLSGTITNVTTAPGTVVTITTAAAHGLNTGDGVTIANVEGVPFVNGTWIITFTLANAFTLDGSSVVDTGAGTYVANTGLFYSASIAGVATNTYTVVVQQAWDATNGIGLPQGTTPATLTLQPTVSIFSALNAGTVDAALGTPTVATPVYLQDAARSVFQMMFGHPDSRPSNFGFPAIAYPPSSNALQLFDVNAFPAYIPSSNSVPVASSYTSPYCYNLSPPDYIIMLLCNPTGSKDMQTHKYGSVTKPIFAKLYITAPYLQISEQMLHSTFAGFQRVNSVSVEFQNPDGSLVEFNGRPHSFSLLFTLYENSSETTCF